MVLVNVKEKPQFQATVRYEPCERMFTETRDLKAYSNLELWSRNLCELFDDSVSGKADLSENRDIETIINNYTFILAAKGYTQKSQSVLETVIAFWERRYLETNNCEYLAKMLQPSVNLARLHLIKNDYDNFWRSINTLAKVDTDPLITLGRVTVSSDSIAQYHQFLRHVTFKEKLKAYLKQGKFNLILEMEKQQPTELIKSIYFREAQIIALLHYSKFQDAESVIRGVMHRTEGLTQNMFYFRLYESFMCQGKYNNAMSILHEINNELSVSPLDNLQDLIFATFIIKEFRAKPTDPLSTRVMSQYQNLTDEMNYTNLLIWYYQDFKSDSIKDKLIEIYKKTQYRFVRGALELEIGLTPPEIESSWIEQLDSKLKRLFH